MTIELDGHLMRAIVAEAAGEWWVQMNGATQVLYFRSAVAEPEIARLAKAYVAQDPSPSGKIRRNGSEPSNGAVTAPMPGVVISVLVQEGQSVKSGDPLIILGAMKMEQTLRSPRDAVVAHIYYQPGESVIAAALLLELVDLQPSSLPTQALP